MRNLAVPLAGLSAKLTGLRIAHISDFHFRRWDRVAQAAQDLLLTVDYDFVVATGDFASGRTPWVCAAEMTRRFFEPIAERFPAYAVLGNHDHSRIAAVSGMPLTFLINQSVLIERSGTTLELAGVDQSSPGKENLEATLGHGRQHEITILLAHYPSTVLRLPPGRVDLQLSGHTHGGQIRLPWLGCLWPNDRIAREHAWGLHVVSGTTLHVNAGIGLSPPFPIRINCPPEVTILTLQPGKHRPRSTPIRESATAATPLVHLSLGGTV